MYQKPDCTQHSPQTTQKPRPPLRKLAIACLVLGACSFPVMGAFMDTDELTRTARWTVTAGIFLFGVLFSFGEWKLGRAKKAALILAAVTLTSISFFLRMGSIV